MSLDVSRFTFGIDTLKLDFALDFVARVPSGVEDYSIKLFAILQEQLRFPEYFGYNWDALSDCLRDFSWIDRRRIVIIHEDIPPLEREAKAIYLDLLSYCVETWEKRGSHELIVVFPEGARDVIRNL